MGNKETKEILGNREKQDFDRVTKQFILGEQRNRHPLGGPYLCTKILTMICAEMLHADINNVLGHTKKEQSFQSSHLNQQRSCIFNYCLVIKLSFNGPFV